MEVDTINSALAANSTRGLDQKSLGLNNKAVRVLDLSQEHTNGRMFEQAVQNANKAGETSSASSDNVKLSNSKVDGNADAKNENPLTLNQKDARQVQEYIEADEEVLDNSGETVLKLALKIHHINYQSLTQMSKDTIVVKGQKIDNLHNADEPTLEQSLPNEAELKIGATSNISEWQLKRQKIKMIAEETYSEIAHLEALEGHAFHSSVVQGVDKAEFSTEVVSLIFDRPAILTK